MAFRPFAKLFVAETFPNSPLSADGEQTRKQRSNSQHLTRSPFQPEDCPAYNWDLELKKLQQKVQLQRHDIRRRDLQFKAVLEENKKLSELRGVVRKRKAQTFALQYRRLAYTKFPRAERDSDCETPCEFCESPLLVAISDAEKWETCGKPRKYSVTPKCEYLNRCCTPRLPAVRAN